MQAGQQATEWALLVRFESVVDNEFRRYHQQLWGEVHPPMAGALLAGVERAASLQQHLSQVYLQIRHEKQTQEQLSLQGS